MAVGSVLLGVLGYYLPMICFILLTNHYYYRLSLNTPTTWSCESIEDFSASNNITCNGDRFRFRTLNGECNNLQYPLEGSQYTHFSRLTKTQYLPPKELINDTYTTPNPRSIARALLHHNDDFPAIPNDNANLLISGWLHFIAHGFFRHETYDITDKSYKIPLEIDDPLYNKPNKYLRVSKLKPSNTSNSQCPYQQFKNTETHWFDASQLYGTNEKVHESMMNNDKFKLFDDNDNEHIADSFSRGWWVGLSLVHNLLQLEHNYVVDELHKQYPLLTSKERYHISRLIISAFITKTHLFEAVPVIMNKDTITKLMDSDLFNLIFKKK
eukprot:212667_1